MDMTCAAFFFRHRPVSTRAKPACMNRAKKPQISIQTMFVALANSDSVGSITAATPCSGPHTMRIVARHLLGNFAELASQRQFESASYRQAIDGAPRTGHNRRRVFSCTHTRNQTRRLRLVQRARATRGAPARDVAEVSADQGALRSVPAHQVRLYRASSGTSAQRVPAARRAVVAPDTGRVLVRWGDQSGADARHPRAEPQFGVPKALAKSAFCVVR